MKKPLEVELTQEDLNALDERWRPVASQIAEVLRRDLGYWVEYPIELPQTAFRADQPPTSFDAYFQAPTDDELEQVAREPDGKLKHLSSEQLTQITGQRAQITKAKRAVSGFRLRENLEIGCRVTLRGKRMFEFLDRLLNLALPRIRDFRGVNPKSFDGNGNYSMGLVEQNVFPEINPDKVTFTQGMDVTFVTSTSQDDEARELLRAFGMPFRDK